MCALEEQCKISTTDSDRSIFGFPGQRHRALKTPGSREAGPGLTVMRELPGRLNRGRLALAMKISVFKTPNYPSPTPVPVFTTSTRPLLGKSVPRPLPLFLQRKSDLAALKTLAWHIYFVLSDLGQALNPPTRPSGFRKGQFALCLFLSLKPDPMVSSWQLVP